jgi:uncharacterized protein (TIGR02271 family)
MTRKKNNEPRRGTVVGLFRSQPDAERAIQELKASAFADHQIGVLMQDPEAGRQLAEDTGTKAGEGARAGAIGGGLLGGLVGLLGAIAIPGIGPIVAGGALASTLAGAGIGAAAGGLLGALMGMGIPEEEARYYESGLKEGGILITVDAEGRREEAEAILANAGAEFGTARAASSASFTGSDRDFGRTIEGGESRLELREEQLNVDKDVVRAGEVRVRKEVVTEDRTIDVPVTREEVVVERRPVEGRPAGRDLDAGEEIRVPLSEERVRVEKTPVVREEVTVNKRRVTDRERVRDTVRREEARVDGTDEVRIDEGELASEPWRGNERRYRHDPAYAGPERRAVRL